MAENCCVDPLAIDGLTGVTATDTKVGAVAVRAVEPDTAPKVAVMVLEPLEATTVASPPEAIVAVAGVPDAHVTEAVKFCVLLSVYVPVAENCCVDPLAIDGLAGVTAIETSVAGVTVKL